MRIGLTEAGWALVLLATLMGCVAFYADLNLLYLLASASLALTGISIAGALASLRGLDIERRLPRQVVAGSPRRVHMDLTHRRRVLLPVGRVVVEEEYRSERISRRFACFFDRPPRRGQAGVSWYTLRLPLRGEYRVAATWLESSYPFGLAYVRRPLRGRSASLVVYPPVGRLWRLPRPEERPGPSPERAAARREPEGEYRSLREYQPGDNPRLIHWRVSAKQHRLQLRELEARSAFQSVTLIVGSRRDRTASAAPDDPCEQAVSLAATLAVRYLGLGHTVSVVSAGGEVPPCSSRRALLRHLALLPAPETDDDLLEALEQALRVRDLRPAVLVVSDRASAGRVLSRLPAGRVPVFVAATPEFERVFLSAAANV